MPEQGGNTRGIDYASRRLNNAEKNYPTMQLEFLALKWAITEKYHDYLYGHSFSVVTDNAPLTYVLTTAKLDATGHRWLAALAAYEFDIIYKPGKKNIDADAMSRYPDSQDEHCIDKEQLSVETVKAVVILYRTSRTLKL